jgi:cytoskeletal protein CcmA (bactofilin family)
MFSRKKAETEDRKMSDAPDDLEIPMKPARPAPQAANVAPLPRTPAAVPPRVQEASRPIDPPRQAEAAVRSTLPAPARLNDADVRKLIVGREVSLTGEINSCEKLIIEGSVEANLQNCQDIDIAESGLFKGSATVDELEIRGRFEGNLVVRKRLLVRSTGRVSGTIRYGQIEIERGGQIAGDVQANPEESGIGSNRAAS